MFAKKYLTFAIFALYTACSGPACAVTQTTKNSGIYIPPAKIVPDTPDPIPCKKISNTPSMMRCFTPEGAVCYVVTTGISCLPLGQAIPTLAEH
jgi:hypothetical protein